VALEHFAGDLRVAGLVGTDQSELACAVEKQERTETGQQQRVCAGAIGHREERSQIDDFRFQILRLLVD
jgi:hypothetical protein